MMMTVYTTCPFCGTINEISVDADGYFNWKYNGELVQNALPELSADEREMLISGICPKCWDNMFPEEEEDEEDYEPDWDLDMGFDPYMGCYTDDC